MAVTDAHGGGLDLGVAEAHVQDPYRSEDERSELAQLVAEVRRLQERRAVAAHLIKLAIEHGVSQGASNLLHEAQQVRVCLLPRPTRHCAGHIGTT
jgi:hypothetical protein